MERKKIEKSLKDWANNLGFRLPSGAALPSDYFAALGATPHRRQLWETIVEIVQPRSKIERMRKEILAARVKGFLGNSVGKEGGDRFELWKREKKLEADVKEKRNEVSKLEKNILSRSSDLVLEICKMAELEKQCEEYKEKKLVLMLYVQRQKKVIRELELIMKNSDSDLLNPCYEDLNSLKEELNKLEITNTRRHSREFNKQEESSWKEESLWEEVIKWKETFHGKFKLLLEEIKSNEKTVLRKTLKIEENLNSSLAELKQRTTEEALEVMVNTKEGKVLNMKIEELIRKLEELYQNDLSFDDSFFTSSPEKEKCLEIFANHAKALALRSYQDYLQDEVKKLEEKENRKESENTFEKYEIILKSLEAVSDEIHLLKSEKQQLSHAIMTLYDELQTILKTAGEKNKEDTYRKTVEESLASLKSAVGKQVAIFVQTPLDAFRKVETSSGRILFECESLAHCLNNYGGEWKEFFTGMLIPPSRNAHSIITELEKRKSLMAEAKAFISEWKKLVENQKNIQDSLNSIKSDPRFCEKNFKDASGILWKISFKSEQIHPEIELLKKILKNWVEQPYRFMIKDSRTVNGLTLRQYEEAYSKENQ